MYLYWILPDGVRIFFGMFINFSASGLIDNRFFFNPDLYWLRLMPEGCPRSTDLVLTTIRGLSFSSTFILSSFLSSPAWIISIRFKKSSLLSMIFDCFSSSWGLLISWIWVETPGNLNYIMNKDKFLKENRKKPSCFHRLHDLYSHFFPFRCDKAALRLDWRSKCCYFGIFSSIRQVYSWSQQVYWLG